VLCHNDRGEWELPGGRPERDEDDRSCLRREIREETGLEVDVRELITAYRFEVIPGQAVNIRAYGCRMSGSAVTPLASEEHTNVDFLTAEDAETVDLPSGYRRAIALWRARTS
jgi:8-oxo-dGTP diphosphatase